jgi:hypothetical protein
MEWYETRDGKDSHGTSSCRSLDVALRRPKMARADAGDEPSYSPQNMRRIS